jgi:hypothetical protein
VGSLVSVSVEVDGRPAALYAAPDGSGRHYFEAREGAVYALRVANRTGERLGIAIAVDGLNVISGERDARRSGRLYVLAAWDTMAVRGWRTSLDEVRRFTFVDEERSYASRAGKANAKMGWVELAVYRERRPPAEVAAPRPEGEPPPAAPERDRAARGRPRSYPGTGWGEATDDPATLVDFHPHPHAAEHVTLRYEYASGLRALGIHPHPRLHARDRLRERDGGFAQPPR